jgi:UDP-glucuronate 4-epimerase
LSIKTVLITGALGFVGINMVRLLAQQSNHVVALARRSPDPGSLRFLTGLADHITWVKGDVTDRDSLVTLTRRYEVSHIFHAAAVTATSQQEYDDPILTFDVNAGGSINVLEAGRRANVERIVYVSSGGLYGSALPLPAKCETDPLEISNLYSISKLTSEYLCRRYNELYELNVVVGRLGTTYGPMERPTGSREKMSAIYEATHAALKGKSATVVGADIARDFCYINDACDAYRALLFTSVLRHDVYNVGSPMACPLRDALDALAEESHFKWDETENRQSADIVQTQANARAGMDISRIQKDTGWLPKFNLDEGVRNYLRWLTSGGDTIEKAYDR